MKIKTVVISVIVTASLIGGGVYGAYYSMQSQKKPVDVIPVANVNYGFWGDTESMSGTIVSKGTQSVRLDGDKTLAKVYVEQGDEVKIGDPLLEYDMTMTELQKEMEDLTRQMLDLNMQSLQKELEKWKKTSPTASLEVWDGVRTASDGEPEYEENAVENNKEEPSPPSGDNPSGDNNPGSDPVAGDESGGEGTGDTSSNDPPPSTNDEPSDPEPSEPDPADGNDPDEPGQLIDSGEEDPENTQGEKENTLSDDLLIEDEDIVSSNSEPKDHEEILRNVNLFLNRFNLLPVTLENPEELYGPDLEQALKVFREKLAAAETSEMVDELGNQRTRTIYSLSPEVETLVGETTAEVLRQAYAKTCLYQYVYSMNQLNIDAETMDSLNDETILSMKEQIQAVLDDYHAVTRESLEEYRELVQPEIEKLGALIVRLRDLEVVEETEAFTEEETEDLSQGDNGDFGDFGGGDFGDGFDGETYTAEEIKEAISNLENDILDCELDIRACEIKQKQYQRELDNKIVKSSMNGVVKSAGAVDEAIAEDDFIVITGEAGMYVKGSLNELKLGTVSVGDMVQGTSYDTGMSFTAEITEISDYPEESNDYWGYSSENSNSSYYPFLAYIADPEGLEEGEVELQIMGNTPSTGIYLEEFFVRSENSNKKYVYIQGEDGLLKKQYVETGTAYYGSVEIRRGISKTDKIAFPYGKNVEEGAQTREVENLDSMYGSYY